MKAALFALLLPLSVLADTTYYQQNIPGTNLGSASRPGYAVERIGGTTTIYQTVPGTTLRNPTAPSYSTFDPNYLDKFRQEEERRYHEGLGR